MSKKKNTKEATMPSTQKKQLLSEDWLSVILAMGFILLASIGVIGKNGISILF